jgi:hypothetical protein
VGEIPRRPTDIASRDGDFFFDSPETRGGEGYQEGETSVKGLPSDLERDQHTP